MAAKGRFFEPEDVSGDSPDVSYAATDTSDNRTRMDVAAIRQDKLTPDAASTAMCTPTTAKNLSFVANGETSAANYLDVTAIGGEIMSSDLSVARALAKLMAEVILHRAPAI